MTAARPPRPRSSSPCEGAVEAAAPEITTIEVESPAEGAPEAAAPGAMVPVDALYSRLHDTASAQADTGALWQPVPELADLEPGAVGT